MGADDGERVTCVSEFAGSQDTELMPPRLQSDPHETKQSSLPSVRAAEPAIRESARPKLAWRLFKMRVREWLVHDSRVFQATAAIAAVAAGWLLYWCRQTWRSLELLSKLHRANYFGWADAAARRLVRASAQERPRPRLLQVYRNYIANLAPLGSSANEECRIDAIAQSWAVISGAANLERITEAMAAAPIANTPP